MHHLALVRSINTNNNDHAKGDYMMQTGYRQTPGFEYPFLGSAFSSLLAPEESPLPHYLVLQTQGDYGNDSAFPLESSFLGPQHAPVSLRGGKPPTNLARPSANASDQRAEAASAASQTGPTIFARPAVRRRRGLQRVVRAGGGDDEPP